MECSLIRQTHRKGLLILQKFANSDITHRDDIEAFGPFGYL